MKSINLKLENHSQQTDLSKHHKVPIEVKYNQVFLFTAEADKTETNCKKTTIKHSLPIDSKPYVFNIF